MTAATAPPPGRPAIDTAELFEPDRRDWLRLLGGFLLALGAAVLYIRKFNDWGEFLKLLVVLIPFVVLFGLGWLPGVRERAEGIRRPEGWQIGFLILGTFLSGFVMAQILLTLGADNLRPRLDQVLVAAVVAGVAYAASFLRAVPFLSIIGGLAALWAWITLWDKIVGIDSIGTGRAFLLIFAALMIAAAVALRAAGWLQTSDFVAVAGFAAILAGLLSVSSLTQQFDPLSDNNTKPTELWNFFILIVSLALIAYGTKAPTRGPSYIGGLGLIAFVGLTGSNIVALANGHGDDVSKFAGWPLLLLLLGIAALAASFFMPREGAAPRGPTTAPEGVPGAPRPGAAYGAPQQYGGAPGQQPGGYPPQQQAPPGGYGGQPTQQQPVPPQQPGQQPPAGGETVARPVPPQPPGQQPPGQGGETVARPVPPPPPGQPGQGGQGGQQPPPGT
jgi:hypothetical protein